MPLLYTTSLALRLHSVTATTPANTAITARRDGSFVIANQTVGGVDQTGDIITATIDASTGTRIAGATPALTEALGWQIGPALALAGPEMALAWVDAGSSLGSTADDVVVWGNFGEFGSALGPSDITIASTTPGPVSNAQITALPNGAFGLFWQTQTTTALTENGEIYYDTIGQGRFYNSSGTAISSVLTYQDQSRNGREENWQQTALGTNRLLVVRESTDADERLSDTDHFIIAQRMTPSGGILDARPLVLLAAAQGGTVDLINVITLTSGDALVLMHHTDSDGAPTWYGLVMNRAGEYDEATPLNFSGLNTVDHIDAVALQNGGFGLVWAGTDADGDAQITLSEYDTTGSLVDAARTIAAPTSRVQTLDAQTNDDGNSVVVWAQDDAGSTGQTLYAVTLGTHCLGATVTGAGDLAGGSCTDILLGLDGADTLDGGAGADTMSGGTGNDLYIVDSEFDVVRGEIGYAQGGGIDTIRAFVSYTQPDNIELLRLGNITDTDNINGTGNDAPGTLVGNAGGNILTGRGGDDQINGNDGADTLIGNTGRDTLVGGEGADTFVLTTIADSRAGRDTRDFINGFTHGEDQIDLSGIDANRYVGGTQDWVWIGNNAFDGQGANSAGQLRWFTFNEGNYNIIEGDLNGDGVANLQVFVNLTNEMMQSDFIL